MKPCPLALLLTAAFAGGVAAQTYDPLAGGPPPAAAQAGARVQAQTGASAPPAAPPPGFNTAPAFDPYGAKPVGPPIQRDRSRVTRLIEVVDGTPRYERLSDWPHEQFDSGQSAMLAMNYSDNLPVDAGMDNPRTTGGPISGVEVPFHYLVKFWDDYPNAKERAGEVPELGVVSNEIVMGWGNGSAPDNVPAAVMADLMHKAGVIRDAIYAYPSIQRSEGVVTRLRIFADVQRDPAGNQVYGFWLRFACDYVGAGYGLIDDAVIEALKLAARTDGIVLDPVYSGKAMKGLIALAKAGRFENETVVFLHTGGAQGLFGYQGELDSKL